MKKKIIGILMLVLIFQTGYGQKNMNQLFNEFSGHASANTVSIGKITMRIAGLFHDTMGVDSIDIFGFENCDDDIKERFAQAVKNLKDTAFETMVNVNEDGKRTKVMIRIKNDVIHELVVLSSGDDPAMIRIKGKIKKSDLEKLVNEHS